MRTLLYPLVCGPPLFSPSVCSDPNAASTVTFILQDCSIRHRIVPAAAENSAKLLKTGQLNK
jgi:hypothetical protein